MSSPLPRPTESELELLKILWQHGPLTVRQIHEHLENGTGYTTALKLLQIMADKGLVERDESSRAHIYTAVLEEASAKRSAVSTLAKKLFGGSGLRLAMQALSEDKASPEELAKIRRLIDQMEGAKKRK
jgi:predicted transcriptional regulator